MAVPRPKSLPTNPDAFGDGASFSPRGDVDGLHLRVNAMKQEDQATLRGLLDIFGTIGALALVVVAGRLSNVWGAVGAATALLLVMITLRIRLRDALAQHTTVHLGHEGVRIDAPSGTHLLPWSDIAWAQVEGPTVFVYSNACEYLGEIVAPSHGTADRDWLAAQINKHVQRAAPLPKESQASPDIDPRLAWIRKTAGDTDV